MRFFLNIFRKKANTTEEKLVYIQESLKEIEEKKKLNLSNEKHLIGSLMLYSFMVYFTCTAFIIIYVKPSETNYWPLYFTPVVAFPFLIFYIKKFIQWFYVRRLGYVDKKLSDLKTKLKDLLTEVIEKETYKRANEILNKFDPDFEFRNMYENFPDKKMRVTADHNSDSELDKKNLTSKPKIISKNMKTVSVNDLRPRDFRTESKRHSNLAPVSPPSKAEIKLVRPLLNQNRTSFDKVIDFIVGDGFDRRYALICKHCNSHNGMALAEEFPFLCFKCAYCAGFNPARQMKPDPPGIFNGVLVRNMKISDEKERGKDTDKSTSDESSVTHRLKNSAVEITE